MLPAGITGTATLSAQLMVSSGPDTGTNAQRQYFQLHHDVGPLAADGSVEIVPPRRSAARHNMRDAAIQHCRAASALPRPT